MSARWATTGRILDPPRLCLVAALDFLSKTYALTGNHPTPDRHWLRTLQCISCQNLCSAQEKGLPASTALIYIIVELGRTNLSNHGHAAGVIRASYGTHRRAAKSWGPQVCVWRRLRDRSARRSARRSPSAPPGARHPAPCRGCGHGPRPQTGSTAPAAFAEGSRQGGSREARRAGQRAEGGQRGGGGRAEGGQGGGWVIREACQPVAEGQKHKQVCVVCMVVWHGLHG